ncbi:MAG TPA: TraR/DksA family transcriptional regulator [Bryobacteraceae bacterium]|nr:TraR/DksA family transcriptional regulator [Bryobacteraceae bacterium]
MTKIELSAFRRALDNTRSELENGNRNREALAIETSADELDRIQHASDRDYAMSSLERNSSRLREVRMALSRIDAGTFGICSACEENINSKRLAAIPWASACTACQEAADREGNMIAGEMEPSLSIAA